MLQTKCTLGAQLALFDLRKRYSTKTHLLHMEDGAVRITLMVVFTFSLARFIKIWLTLGLQLAKVWLKANSCKNNWSLYMFIMNFYIILLHAAHTLVFKRAFRAKQLCQSAHTLSNPFPRLHNPFHVRHTSVLSLRKWTCCFVVGRSARAEFPNITSWWEEKCCFDLRDSRQAEVASQTY